MKIKDVLYRINKILRFLDSVDFINNSAVVRKSNQTKVNLAYEEINKLKDEIIRENIRLNQKKKKNLENT